MNQLYESYTYIYWFGISQTSLILANVIRSFLPTFIGLGIFITPYILNKLLCVAV